MAKDTDAILTEVRTNQKYIKERFDKLEHRLDGVSSKRIDSVEKDIKSLTRQHWTIAGLLAALVAAFKHGQ